MLLDAGYTKYIIRFWYFTNRFNVRKVEPIFTDNALRLLTKVWIVGELFGKRFLVTNAIKSIKVMIIEVCFVKIAFLIKQLAGYVLFETITATVTIERALRP